MYYLVATLVLLELLVRVKKRMVVVPWRGRKPSASIACSLR